MFDRFGTAHLVCNNAGVGVGGLTWTVPADRWRWIVEVNLLGVAHGIRAFVPRLIEQGEGHVVNTASAAGMVTGPGMAPYFATKHAVVALSESLYFDLQLVGAPVGVSVLCPGGCGPHAESGASGDVSAVDLAGNPVDPEAAPDRSGGASIVQGLVEGGIDPAEVADAVLDGVRRGRFWIFTHDTTVPHARKRWEAIASDGSPVFWDLGLV